MNSTSVATSANFTRRTLTVTEAAVCLGLSRNAAYQGIRDGTIPALRIGRRILVPAHALHLMLAGGLICATQGKPE